MSPSGVRPDSQQRTHPASPAQPSPLQAQALRGGCVSSGFGCGFYKTVSLMISQPNHVRSVCAPLFPLIEKRESENGPVLQNERAKAKLLSGEMILAAASAHSLSDSGPGVWVIW